MNIQSLAEASSVDNYLSSLQSEEASRKIRSIEVRNVELTPSGLLSLGGELFEFADAAKLDLAKLARIPYPYFNNIDAPLRASNFNARLSQFLGMEDCLEVTVSNDNSIHRVQRPRFAPILASLAIETLMDEAPSDTVSNGIRAIEYVRDRRLEVALVSPALSVEPRNGDIICGGVHLTIEENGAVQVGPESFRLVCRNGAMARVCAGGHHRLRRGAGKESDRKFLVSLRKFARTAWQDWGYVKTGIKALAQQPLAQTDIGHVVSGLRQSPFFISAQAARRIREQLEPQADDLTLYDLHNAITFVGTHDREVLPEYRYRLRLGAGQLSRGRVGVCHECHRLMIGAASSAN